MNLYKIADALVEAGVVVNYVDEAADPELADHRIVLPDSYEVQVGSLDSYIGLNQIEWDGIRHVAECQSVEDLINHLKSVPTVWATRRSRQN